ncbi:glycoside hydrolase family 28 protein [Parasediminibacterium sp. JCM 36343]|uniref:glycoside hydrolase family 28 protein n=1 Tax=Parasediminibacterium sp. JCM 36343 TaxID=3374279 RepID=UPI00397BD07D
MKLKQIACCVSMALATLTSTAQKTNYSWDNLPKAAKPTFKKDTFNILKYGAVADGITLNTKSINDAIDACSKKGGGVVLVPQGFWMTGPIVFKSNVNLHLNGAALLQFTNDKSQYPLVIGNWEGHPSPRNQSPISGTDLTNIAITGEGIIDGHGEAWRYIGKDKLTEPEWKQLVASGGIVSEDKKTWYPSESFMKGAKTKDAISIQPGKTLKDYEDMKDFFRANMVVFNNCKKVLLQNTTFRNSPAWCLHMLLCEDLTLLNVTVHTEWNAQNGDAIDVESCKNVLIEGSNFSSGDDGICVKSGRDEDGRKRGIPTENMVVHNCTVYRGHGGFVIGSEMSGGAKNIFVSECTFIGTDIGLRFKTTRGRGGIVEKIYIKNISMKDILHEAILFDMYYMVKAGKKELKPVTEATPQFKDFYVSDIVCDGAEKAIMIRGLPEMSIKGIHLENMVLKSDKGAEIIEADDISLKNISLLSKDTNPSIFIDNGSNLSFDNIKYTNNAGLLFSINGDKSAQIKVRKTDVSKAAKQAEFNNGATEKALILSN